MPHAFRIGPDAAGAKADDGPVYHSLICRRRPARADQVSSDDPPQAVDTCWLRSPTARQDKCHSQSGIDRGMCRRIALPLECVGD